jgi:hypothetical protein
VNASRRGTTRAAGNARPALGGALLAGLLLASAACSSSTGAPTVPVGSGAPGPDETLPIGESIAPASSGPESTAIPGYEDWSLVNGEAVDIGETETGFGMILTAQAAWSKAGQGVLFHATAQGDFRITATVTTTKSSDASLPPGGDGSTQLAGLMVRLAGTHENWLFLAVGADGPGLAVDVLSTANDQTSISGTDWSSGAAELKLCRVGSRFQLWMRPVDSEEDWVAAGSANRKDLAGTVQVGAAMSADTEPDITALFDGLTVEPLEAGEDC